MQEPHRSSQTNDSGESATGGPSKSSGLHTKEHDAARAEERTYYGNYSEDEIDRQLSAFREWMVFKFKDAKLIDLAQIVTGLIIVVVGVWAAIIYYKQLLEMRHTNDLTQQALIGSGAALGETLAKMQGQIEATTKLYGEAQKQTRQAAKTADASGRQADIARDSIQVAKDTMYLEQRPWVGVFVSSAPIGAISNSPNTAASRIVIHNSGRTPALHWRQACMQMTWRGFDDERVPDCEQLEIINKQEMIEELLKEALKYDPRLDAEAFRERQRKSQIQLEELRRGHSPPNEGQTLVPDGVSDLGISFMISNDLHLQWRYQVGTIIYYDPIRPNEEHLTRYCLKQSNSTSPWELCHFGQEMN